MGMRTRKYIRHPSDIPIEVEVEDHVEDHDMLNNISAGGLSFHSNIPIELNRVLTLRIPAVQPPFETRGKVMWCHETIEGYDVGIKLLNRDQVYHARMVEQICHIEHYKRQVFQKEGRLLSGEQAAKEWIAHYANDFPALDSNLDKTG